MRLKKKAWVRFCRTLEIRWKGLCFIVTVICGCCAEKHFGLQEQKQGAVTITRLRSDEGVAIDDSNEDGGIEGFRI